MGQYLLLCLLLHPGKLGKKLPGFVIYDAKNFTTSTPWGKLVGSWAKTKSSNDAFKLFKFASDHSDVEWALQKFSGGRFLIGTSHFSDAVGNLFTAAGYNTIELHLDYHSHPGTSPADDVASGGFGDQGHASGIIHKFLEAKIDYKYHPTFRIYRPDTAPQRRFDYSPWSKKFNVIKVRTYKDL